MVARADSVKVAWTGTGTGTMSLGGVISGFRAFPALANGETVSYLIEHQGESTIERENGRGVYTSSGNTLTRTVVTHSTNNDALVNFSAGTKHVSLVLLATDVGNIASLDTPAISIAADDDDLTVTDASGANILVTYGGLLTANRSVDIDSAALPEDDSVRMVFVLNNTVGDGGSPVTFFTISVVDEGSNEIVELEQGWGLLAHLTSDGASRAMHFPLDAGVLAALDEIGAAHLTPGVISGQSAQGSAADTDRFLMWRASDSLLYYITKANLLSGVSGTVPSPSVVTISGTTHTLTDAQRAHLNVLLLVNNSNQACAITVPDASAAGSVWRVRSRTTNTVTITRATNGTINGGTSVAMTGLGREVKIEVESNAGTAPVTTVEGETTEATVADANHNMAGFDILNIGNASTFETPATTLAALGGLPLAGGTVTGTILLGTGGSISDAGPIAATGTLVKATHGGRAVRTTGNVTIPNTAGDVGMGGIIIIGTAGHTITFGAASTAGLAVDDVVTYYVSSTTILLRSIQTWASRLAMS
jgi:hypothetical protein